MDVFVIEPCFFDSHLNGNRYLDFLNNALPELLKSVPHNIKRTTWYHDDTAPCHCDRNVCNFLIIDSVIAGWINLVPKTTG